MYMNIPAMQVYYFLLILRALAGLRVGLRALAGLRRGLRARVGPGTRLYNRLTVLRSAPDMLS